MTSNPKPDTTPEKAEKKPQKLKKPIADEWLTRQQVAWLYGVSEETVRYWISLETEPLPHKGIHKNMRHHKDEVREWYIKYERKRWQATTTDTDEEIKRWKIKEQSIKVGTLLKEYLPAVLIFAVFMGILARLKLSMLSVPNRLRSLFGEAAYLEAKTLIDAILKNAHDEIKRIDDVEKIANLYADDSSEDE